MNITDLEDKFEQFKAAREAVAFAQSDLFIAKEALTDAVLAAGLTDALDVNLPRLRRMIRKRN